MAFKWEGRFIRAYQVRTTGLWKIRRQLRIEQKEHIITKFSEFSELLKKHGLFPAHGLYNARNMDIYYAKGPRGGDTVWYRLKYEELIKRLVQIDNELLLIKTTREEPKFTYCEIKEGC